MSNKKEVVVCAAVRFEREHERSGIEYNVNVLCVNYEDDAIAESRDRFESNLYVVVIREIQGFITNQDRFVTPQEALILTGRQREMRFQNRKYLLPEDLY